MKQRMIPVKTALITTFNQQSLKNLIEGLLTHCPDVLVLSTGTTLQTLTEILGSEESKEHLRSVEEFLGHSIEGPGVPRTLDWRLATGLMFDEEIHAPLQEKYGVLPIELLVCNTSMFGGSVAKGAPNIETARKAIEIERPYLIRTAIRGLNRCTVLTSPEDYGEFLLRLREQDGCTDIMDRAQFAAKAMNHLTAFDIDVARYLRNLIASDPNTVFEPYAPKDQIEKVDMEALMEELDAGTTQHAASVTEAPPEQLENDRADVPSDEHANPEIETAEEASPHGGLENGDQIDPNDVDNV